MASKTLIDVNQVVKNTYNSTKATPNSIDVTKDLLQRLAELTAKTTEFIEKVDGIEPAMNTIYNLRDQMENLENRTITIVSQFQEQIFLKEDQADQIILDLNEEVQRVEDHIDDLLGLAEGFESIVDEINTLLGIESRVQELEKYISSVENSSSTTIIGPDDDDVDRVDGNLYMVQGSTTSSGGKTYIETSYEDADGNIMSFVTSSDTGKVDPTGTTLFQGLSKTANYSGSAAPYTQTVSVPGILASDEPLVGLIPDATNVTTAQNQEKAWGNVSRIVTNNNSITIYCNKKKPEVALNLRLVVFRTT